MHNESIRPTSIGTAHGERMGRKRTGTKEYPQSAWTEQAKIWVPVMQESENVKRIAANLTQENDRLKRMIEESKKVDIQIEEKKREQAR
jgi:hypothetical protein